MVVAIKCALQTQEFQKFYLAFTIIVNVILETNVIFELLGDYSELTKLSLMLFNTVQWAVTNGFLLFLFNVCTYLTAFLWIQYDWNIYCTISVKKYIKKYIRKYIRKYIKKYISTYIFIDVTSIDQFCSVYIGARSLNKDLFRHGQYFCARCVKVTFYLQFILLIIIVINYYKLLLIYI